MNIHHTVPYFLENFVPTEEFLHNYHEKYPASFREYIRYHGSTKDEKLAKALTRYEADMHAIREISGKIESLIDQVTSMYKETYDVTFEKDVHVIVGVYGSNAFTERAIIPEITFSVERLSPVDEHLKVIIAHEFGHVLHGKWSVQANTNWSKVDWTHLYTMLLQEGCATYFSKQTIDADEIVYFTYDETDEEWLRFAKGHIQLVVTTFIEDVSKFTAEEVRREWISIYGGTHFGYSRLAYYIGYLLVERLVAWYGEFDAVTIWKGKDFYERVENALCSLL